MSKVSHPPTNAPLTDQHLNVPHRTSGQNPKSIRSRNIGCIIQSGVSYAKLQRLQKGTTEELSFNLKFFRYVDGRYDYLTTGAGVLIFIRIQDIHASSSGLHITGQITRTAQNNVMGFGKHFVERLDDITVEWLRTGHFIQLLHRGAADQGLIINITKPTPDGKNADISNPASKLRFCTKRAET